MKYLLMIYENEKLWESLSQEDTQKILGEYAVFTESLEKSGSYIAGEALEPTPTATTVRIRDGKRLTTDGPFAETREQLGGFYLVEAKDLDEAIAMASRIPNARTGSIEVRPIMDYSKSMG
ncbi:DGPF domain-containing protein [Myxococcus stipitatus DSM 14675]|uniref:DGPF domain-containing protein n=1 Tax=Myxococcus stipitatus (strain DSM 14675 / JCM 12634 / Mx s8) TaxID=1278073 RepID=L7UFD5_MYXSD|nr:YciI family protein [Myxococcus stipitatus]AGC46575.1 DGPF domain-containing protein [Myxococcus stipitatus DSM 14675]